MTFLDCLNEFPEFTDEAVNASIRAFDGDLRVRLLAIFLLSSQESHCDVCFCRGQYWASCLEAYEGQLRYPAVER
jgi:WD repeat-containing protein 26